jgi:hypothetical protein
VHHGGNPLNNMARLQFACAIRNTTYFEVLLTHGAHKHALLDDIAIRKDASAGAAGTSRAVGTAWASALRNRRRRGSVIARTRSGFVLCCLGGREHSATIYAASFVVT